MASKLDGCCGGTTICELGGGAQEKAWLGGRNWLNPGALTWLDWGCSCGCLQKKLRWFRQLGLLVSEYGLLNDF